MKRKFTRMDEEIPNRLLWIIIIVLLLLLFNTQRGHTQEYDCTISTSGVIQYSSLDDGVSWKTVNVNTSLQSTFEFLIGYECFLQTIEDTIITYKIQKDSIRFDTMTMHMEMKYLGDWDIEYKMDIWFNDPVGLDDGNKVIVKWKEGTETCLLVYTIKSWEIINVPLNLQIKMR